MGKQETPMVGTMLLRTAVTSTFIQNSVLHWIIPKYTQLEVGRLYFQTYATKDFNCVYKLFKANRKLFIAFYCGYAHANGAFYLSNGVPMSKLVQANEISDGLYVGEFPESLILHTEGIYATKGLLNIAFKFLRDCTMDLKYYPFGQIGVYSDAGGLCHDIQSVYLDSIQYDFIINVADMSMRTHKCVLYARSGFFKEYLEKDKKATEFRVLDTVPGIMNVVLLYMYSGELPGLDTECMVKVWELAYLLKMPALKDRCFSFFQENNSWEAVECVEFFEYKIDD